MEAFDEIAMEGTAAHFELNRISSSLQQYFAETSMSAECGKYAFLGLGFCAFQFEKSYQNYRNQVLDEIHESETANLDYNDLL